MKNTSGVILAGGKSSRMGTNKAFIEIGESKIIEKTVEMYRDIFDEVIISSNDPKAYEYLGVKIYKDIIPEKGPLSGIHSALSNSSNMYCFVTACDMPFLEPKLIKLLLSEAEGYDVAVPKLGQYLQPLYAVYSKNCIEPIEESVSENIFRVPHFYSKVNVKYIGEESIYPLVDPEKVFFNVNTKSDLEKARELRSQES